LEENFKYELTKRREESSFTPPDWLRIVVLRGDEIEEWSI